MFRWVVLILLIQRVVSEMQCPTIPPGEHKEKPSAEELKGCKKYSCNSCCTAEKSKALAARPLQAVGRFNFTQCGRPLTGACSDSFQALMCFYKCSPNLYPFFGNTSRDRIPLCSWFCDKWYNACAGDLTCVINQNWLLGFNYHGKGEVDKCREGSVCRNFTQTYRSGQQMCDNLFGQIFMYSDNENECLNPFEEDRNTDIIKESYPGVQTSVCDDSMTSYADAGKICGIVFGVLGGIFLVLLGIAFYRKRSGKKENIQQPKKKEKGTRQEMTTMTKNKETVSPPITNSPVPKDVSSSDEE